MNSRNIGEIKQIQTEMQDIRSCVTSYTGYVLGGSGLVVTGFLLIRDDDLIKLGVSSIAIAFIMILVLVVLMYKFSSHNRMAGYIKAVTFENANPRFSTTVLKGHEHEYWKINNLWAGSVGTLTHYISFGEDSKLVHESIREKTSELLSNTLETPELVKNISSISLFNIIRPSPLNARQVRFGMRIFKRCLNGSIRTESWMYPVLISTIFIVLILLFYGVGISLVFLDFPIFFFENIGTLSGIKPIFISFLLIIISIWFWRLLRYMYRNLYGVTKGSSTVDAYMWSFLIVRGSKLANSGFGVSYPNLGLSWTERCMRRIRKRIVQAMERHGGVLPKHYHWIIKANLPTLRSFPLPTKKRKFRETCKLLLPYELNCSVFLNRVKRKGSGGERDQVDLRIDNILAYDISYLEFDDNNERFKYSEKLILTPQTVTLKSGDAIRIGHTPKTTIIFMGLSSFCFFFRKRAIFGLEEIKIDEYF